VIGAVIMVIVLVVVLPVAFLMGGAVLAAIFGQSLSKSKERDYQGTELGDLS
jgi:hypothetical protein